MLPPLDVVRRSSDVALLELFFGSDTPSILAAHDGCLARVVHPDAAIPADQAQGHLLLLAAKELWARGHLVALSRTELTSPALVCEYLGLHFAGAMREHFAGIWLDTQHRVILAEDLFVGTLTQTGVYPREVVRRALQLGAAAVIFAHNHPSGVAEPSRADELLTTTLKHALALVDVRVLDHFVIAGPNVLSFAKRGLL